LAHFQKHFNKLHSGGELIVAQGGTPQVAGHPVAQLEPVDVEP